MEAGDRVCNRDDGIFLGILCHERYPGLWIVRMDDHTQVMARQEDLVMEDPRIEEARLSIITEEHATDIFSVMMEELDETVI
jgi:hypothetical protein